MEKRHMFRSTSQHRATMDIHKRAAMACKGKDDDMIAAVVRNVVALGLVVSLLILVMKL